MLRPGIIHPTIQHEVFIKLKTVIKNTKQKTIQCKNLLVLDHSSDDQGLKVHFKLTYG